MTGAAGRGNPKETAESLLGFLAGFKTVQRLFGCDIRQKLEQVPTEEGRKGHPGLCGTAGIGGPDSMIGERSAGASPRLGEHVVGTKASQTRRHGAAPGLCDRTAPLRPASIEERTLAALYSCQLNPAQTGMKYGGASKGKRTASGPVRKNSRNRGTWNGSARRRQNTFKATRSAPRGGRYAGVTATARPRSVMRPARVGVPSRSVDSMDSDGPASALVPGGSKAAAQLAGAEGVVTNPAGYLESAGVTDPMMSPPGSIVPAGSADSRGLMGPAGPIQAALSEGVTDGPTGSAGLTTAMDWHGRPGPMTWLWLSGPMASTVQWL